MAPVSRFFTLLVLICAALGTLPALAGPALPEDGHAGVILAYHRIGEDDNPDSSITNEQFLAHIDEIVKGGYTVLPLPVLLDSLKKGDNLAPRTLAITFEGGFKSAFLNAIPALLQKNIPFTVFFSSDYADADTAQYMNWKDLKILADNKNVTLGILPASYTRLGQLPVDQIRYAINKARQRYRDQLGREAKYFSYPFGEYSLAYKKIISDSGFEAAFGLQSGAAYSASDFYALPRFSMTEKYGDLDRFRMVAQALPFPATDIEPADSYLGADGTVGFSVPETLAASLKSLSCFISDQSEPKVQIVGQRVELRLAGPSDEDHLRVNCTLPGPAGDQDDQPLWRWFGMLLVNPEAPSDDPGDQTSNPPPDGLP